MISIGPFILALLGAAAPAHARDNAGIRSLEKALKNPVATLVGKLHGKVCVMDFSDLAQKGYTSEFGQKVADLLSNHLVNRNRGGYMVMERRELVKITHDSILMIGDDEAAISDLQKQGGMDVLVSGTYSVAEPEVSIDIKAVDAHGGGLLASGTARFKVAEGLKSMLSHRFRELGPAEPEGAPPGAGGQSAAIRETAPKPAQDATDAHPGVDVLELETGVFYEGGDGKLYPLREGMVLNAKDNYAIYLKPRQPCYVYVYQVDSTRKAFRLFPNPEYSSASGPLVEGKEYWIPEGRDYLYLDETRGIEDLYVFATRAPAPALEGIKEANNDSIKGVIRTMGVAGRRGGEAPVRTRGARGESMDLVTRKLAAQGDFFYKVSFVHQ